jgi:hypothetical protein
LVWISERCATSIAVNSLSAKVPSPEYHEIYAKNNYHLRVFQASLYQNTSVKISFFLYLYIIIYLISALNQPIML